MVSPCLPKAPDRSNTKLNSRQERDRWGWQSERMSRRRHLGSRKKEKRMREKEGTCLGSEARQLPGHTMQ